MLALVLRALRARRAQALTVFALALVAGVGSAAAPWFLVWGSDAVARANIASAPPTEYLVVASGSPRYGPGTASPVQSLRDQVARHLAVPGAQTQVGARVLASISAAPAADGPAPASPPGAGSISAHLAYHDDVCEHVDLVAGTCPGDQGDVVIARSAAGRLGLGVGDRVVVVASQMSRDATLRVSGVYDRPDGSDSYWAGTGLLPAPGGTSTAEPALVSEQTLLDLPLNSMDVEARVLLPDRAFVDPGLDLAQMLNQATAQLRPQSIDVSSTVTSLIGRISHDRWLVVVGVSVGAAQLLLVCWVALFLAVRHTSEDRRADVGLLKLRGTTTRRVWLLVALQSVVPTLAGTVLGAGVGFLAAAGLAHSVSGVAPAGLLDVAHARGLSTLDTVWLSLAAAALAGFGVLAAVATEWRTIRAPVVDLLRRVPSRRRRRRADVAELVLLVVAGAGVYQARVEAAEGGEASALALLAPTLVGIAVALVLARALLPLAARFGARALRAGRAGVALAGLQLARRQGTHRVFAVLAVAAAVFTTTTTVWRSANSAWQQRAVVEHGAGQVLSVDASSAAALLAAVRAVDPEGRYAMAVAGALRGPAEDRILGVDATRLARVGQVPDGLPSAGDIAALLRPPAAEPPLVGDGQVLLDAALLATTGGPTTGGGGPFGVRLYLSTVDGSALQVDFPTLAPGRHAAEASVAGCAAGCRLVALQVTAPPAITLAAPVTVEILELSQGGRAILSGAMLGDVARWRTSLGYPVAPPEVSPHDGRLAITWAKGSAPGSAGVDGRVLPLTAPAPLPVVVAGAPPETHGGDTRIAVLSGIPVPVRVAATVRLLPQLGERGMLVDLEYALRTNDAPTDSVDLSVWMTTDAPGTLVAALADRGVTVRGQSSVATRVADLAGGGPGLALLFGYFAAAVVLLLAAGVAVVGATVERVDRVAELAALRGQGLSVRAVRGAGVAGTAVLVGAATLTGVLAALLAQILVTAGLPVFSDGWALLPVPAGLTPATLAASVAAVVAVIGIAALSGAGRLVAAVESITQDGETAP